MARSIDAALCRRPDVVGMGSGGHALPCVLPFSPIAYLLRELVKTARAETASSLRFYCLRPACPRYAYRPAPTT